MARKQQHALVVCGICRRRMNMTRLQTIATAQNKTRVRDAIFACFVALAAVIAVTTVTTAAEAAHVTRR